MLLPSLPASESLPALRTLEAGLVLVHEQVLPEVGRPREQRRALMALEVLLSDSNMMSTRQGTVVLIQHSQIPLARQSARFSRASSTPSCS